MSPKNLLVLTLFVILLMLASAFQPKADMPNPASVYCEENEGRLELRQDESGGQVGICVFEDGSECEEWAYYRGECQPGDSLNPQSGHAKPASVYCEENWGTLKYHEDETGGQVGYCLFEDGSECEEWAFYQGDCQQGED